MPTYGNDVWRAWYYTTPASTTTTTSAPVTWAPTSTWTPSTTLGDDGWVEVGYTTDDVYSWNSTTPIRQVFTRHYIPQAPPPSCEPCEECGAGTAGRYSHGPDCSVTAAIREEQRRIAAEREDLNRRRRERVEREAVERRAAEVRANELLRLVLSDAEWSEWESEGHVTLAGSDGRTYRVREGTLYANVDVLGDDDGQPVERICAHPDQSTHDGGWLVMPDAHVGQVLAIKADAEAFHARANVHWRRDDPQRPQRAAMAA